MVLMHIALHIKQSLYSSNLHKIRHNYLITQFKGLNMQEYLTISLLFSI